MWNEFLSLPTINGQLQTLEKHVRRWDFTDIANRNHMLEVYQTLKISNKIRAQTACPTKVDKVMMHKGKNLLDYEGDPTDFRAVGRFLVKLIHDDKQRQDLVCSPRKSKGHKYRREKADPSDTAAFKEAVKKLCGTSSYAYLRAKDGANQVEGVIRDDYLVEALEMTEMCCELLVGRIGILETTSNDVAPLDLEECICSILFAARRIYQDVPEMVEITRQLQKKFKKEAFAQLQQSESRKANQKLVSRLDIRPPPKALVEQYLVEIAKSHNVDFNPDPLALDGSVDALSSSDFGAVDGDSNNKGGGGGGHGGGGGMPGGAATADTEYIDLINFDPNGAPSGTHQPPPNAAAHGIGPGYPMQQQQPQMFPQAPPLNPNYNPNMIGPYTPHHIPPPGAHNPMGPSNAPSGAPSNGVPRPPPSYEESGGESGEKERMGGDEFPNANNGDASTGQDNLQQWSDLQFNLPPVPEYLNGGGGLSDSPADSATVPPPTGPPGGNQQQGPPDENGAGAGVGEGGVGASLDMDDLEARLRRLKGL